MLDEIVVSGTIGSYMIDQFAYYIQLMITWEDDFATDCFSCRAVR